MIYDDLYSKTGKVTLIIANEILTLKPGSTMPTIKSLSKRLGVGIGTIQSAIRCLNDIGAITIRARGQLGTIIEKLDYEKLLTLTENQQIITGSGPMPPTQRQMGLITGIYENFFKAKKTVIMSYMRGSRNRHRLISTNKVNFILLSRLATKKVLDTGIGKVIHSFDCGTYHESFYMVSRKNKPVDKVHSGLRVGLDIYSYEHEEIVKNLCSQHDVIYIDWVYTQMIEKLIMSDIDLAVVPDFLIKQKLPVYEDKLHIIALEEAISKPMKKVVESALCATILVNSHDQEVQKLLNEILSYELIASIQKLVIEGKVSALH